MSRLAWILAALLLPATGWGATLTADTVWRGSLVFGEPVRVEKGVTLTVEPGTEISWTGGSLEVAGTLRARGVTFRGSDWEGITLRGGESDLEDCTITGARTGVRVLGGAPRLARVRVTGCGTGIELRQQTLAVLESCRLEGNSEVGLFVKDASTPTVTGCRLAGNGRFGGYIYRAQPLRFEGNLFQENPVGLMISFFGSDPTVVGNRFAGNDVAIQVDRAARPVLENNELSGNGTGLLLSRRADARVSGNRINGNRIGIQVQYSSYPLIHKNDLAGNGRALVLDHQSSSWEQANGAAMRAAESSGRGAFGQKGRPATEAERRPAALTGSVDARNNWWGEMETKELARLGADGNPGFIHDGRDEPYFEDGGRKYPLDRVKFAPWLAKPSSP